jgi:putative flavoprotein involved in K+ transport
VKTVDTIIIGGGQAGVSLSYSLSRLGVEHLVLERDRPFSSWRNRWDGFRTNTPNWMNTLPVLDDQTPPSNDPNGFATRDEIVAYFEDCLCAVSPPILTETEVTCVEHLDDGKWKVEAAGTEFRARAVAICNGAMSVPRLPPSAAALPRDVPQLHSSQYRSPDQINTVGVLVVGTASSGVQIARLLCESGRFERIHAAQSKVMVLPKHLLGIPTHKIIHRLGLFDVRTTAPLGRLMYSGLEVRGDPIMRPTPRDLKRKYGLDLRGRLSGFDGQVIQFADGSSLSCDDLTVIWCTGFQPDYEFLILDDRNKAFLPSGHPIHQRGISDAVPGLFFVGLRYQDTVASHDIYGVARDAEFVANAICRHLEPQREMASSNE